MFLLVSFLFLQARGTSCFQTFSLPTSVANKSLVTSTLLSNCNVCTDNVVFAEKAKDLSVKEADAEGKKREYPGSPYFA